MRIFKFGPHNITADQIFLCTKYSFGLVNLKPVVPGHVLVISRRVVPRFQQLTAEENNDLFLAAKIISKQVESIYKAESLTLTIQDGPQAGQSVPHIHLHLIPRYTGDWMNNDDIYGEINRKERQMHKDLGRNRVDNDDRVARSQEDMAEEAARLRGLFDQYEDIWMEKSLK